MDQIINLAVKPINRPRNRAEKRELVKELTKLNALVFDVEDLFLKSVSELNKSTFLEYDFCYKTCYEYYLMRYAEKVDYINEVYKPKNCVVDKFYFMKVYKSVV